MTSEMYLKDLETFRKVISFEDVSMNEKIRNTLGHPWNICPASGGPGSWPRRVFFCDSFKSEKNEPTKFICF